jgi:hypothetical protein
MLATLKPVSKDNSSLFLSPVDRVDFVLDDSAVKSVTMQLYHLRTSHTHYWSRFDILNLITQVMVNDVDAPCATDLLS